MFEKRKRGNGTALMDYYEYKHHINKLNEVDRKVSDVEKYYDGEEGVLAKEKLANRLQINRERERRQKLRNLAISNINIY